MDKKTIFGKVKHPTNMGGEALILVGCQLVRKH